jgi:hypothetical protein
MNGFFFIFRRIAWLMVIYTLGFEVLFLLAAYCGAPLVDYLATGYAGYHALPWSKVQRLVVLAPALALLLSLITLLSKGHR